MDLTSDLTMTELAQRLDRPRGKVSLANRLRKVLRLELAKWVLLNEFARPLPSQPPDLAYRIEDLHIEHSGLRAMDDAISTAGGLRQQDLTEALTL